MDVGRRKCAAIALKCQLTNFMFIFMFSTLRFSSVLLWLTLRHHVCICYSLPCKHQLSYITSMCYTYRILHGRGVRQVCPTRGPAEGREWTRVQRVFRLPRCPEGEHTCLTSPSMLDSCSYLLISKMYLLQGNNVKIEVNVAMF